METLSLDFLQPSTGLPMRPVHGGRAAQQLFPLLTKGWQQNSPCEEIVGRAAQQLNEHAILSVGQALVW